jgi:hypothetical protein
VLATAPHRELGGRRHHFARFCRSGTPSEQGGRGWTRSRRSLRRSWMDRPEQRTSSFA